MARDSELDLPAIKKLCEAATPESWTWGYNGSHFYVLMSEGMDLKQLWLKSEADAEFIAQARTLVPQLVEELEEAWGWRAAAREVHPELDVILGESK